jgi:hypothetical protein
VLKNIRDVSVMWHCLNDHDGAALVRVKHGYKNAICTSMGEALMRFLMLRLILVLPNPRGAIAPAHMVQQCILNFVCTGHRSDTLLKLKVRRGIERFPVFDRPQLPPQ